MSLDNLPDYVLLEYLERLPDEDLETYCNPPLNKKFQRVCSMDGDFVQRLKDVNVASKIKKAWEQRDEELEYYISKIGDYDNMPSNRFSENPIEFTGTEFDPILTRMSQVTSEAWLYENDFTGGLAPTFRDSVAYKLYFDHDREFIKNKLTPTIKTFNEDGLDDEVTDTFEGVIAVEIYDNDYDYSNLSKLELIGLYGYFL